MAAAALALTACAGGGASTSTSTGGSGSSTAQAEIHVQTAPNTPGADIFLGFDEGIYAAHGITLVPPFSGASPTDAVPRLLHGDLQFIFADAATLVSSLQQNVGLVAVAPGTVGNGAKRGGNGVVAASGITRFKDLEGKNVQVSILGGSSQMLVSADVAQDGGNPSKVNWVELPTTQAVTALQSGRVDAIVTAEPNVTAALDLGFHYVGNPDLAAVGVPVFMFLTSKAYADANPEVVRQFAAATLEANAFANANPDKVRSSTVTYSGADPALLAKATMPLFGEKPLTVQQFQDYIDLLVEYGGLDKSAAPDASKGIWAGLS